MSEFIDECFRLCPVDAVGFHGVLDRRERGVFEGLDRVFEEVALGTMGQAWRGSFRLSGGGSRSVHGVEFRLEGRIRCFLEGLFGCSVLFCEDLTAEFASMRFVRCGGEFPEFRDRVLRSAPRTGRCFVPGGNDP